MKTILVTVAIFFALPVLADQYQGQLTVNPYAPNAISPTEAQSHYNNAKLYNSQGEYRGTVSNDRYAPDSTSNPYGQYGSRYSNDSINNPYGAGSRYNSDSPNNPYGNGLKVYK